MRRYRYAIVNQHGDTVARTDARMWAETLFEREKRNWRSVELRDVLYDRVVLAWEQPRSPLEGDPFFDPQEEPQGDPPP
jgi:hypothetical protein